MVREKTVISQLADLYESYGYSYYKVSKFEEYDLYVRNKNFLSGNRILTFNDADGSLKALKPDVTLSVVKNTKDSDPIKKIYYKENVYRVLHRGDGFKEIMQTGLECIGNIDMYSTGEVIMLAAASLETISSEYILDVSHIEVVSGLLDGMGEAERKAVMKAMNEKNIPVLNSICESSDIPDCRKALLRELIKLYEPIDMAISRLNSMNLPPESMNAVKELDALCEVLKIYGIDKNVYVDFSIRYDTEYYNGIFFKGFISGIAESVLSGGRYDKLMSKLGKKAGAIGFAVYLNQIEALETMSDEYDVDVLIKYSENSSVAEIIETADRCIKSGKTVRVQRTGEIKYREVIEIGADD